MTPWQQYLLMSCSNKAGYDDVAQKKVNKHATVVSSGRTHLWQPQRLQEQSEPMYHDITMQPRAGCHNWFIETDILSSYLQHSDACQYFFLYSQTNFSDNGGKAMGVELLYMLLCQVFWHSLTVVLVFWNRYWICLASTCNGFTLGETPMRK